MKVHLNYLEKYVFLPNFNESKHQSLAIFEIYVNDFLKVQVIDVKTIRNKIANQEYNIIW